MMNISRVTRHLAGGLNHQLAFRAKVNFHHDGDELPRQYNFRFFTKEQRKVLYGPKIRPKMQERFHDVLTLPSQERGLISDLFTELL